MKLSLSNIAVLVAGAATILFMAYVFEGARPALASPYTANTIATATTTNSSAITTSARILATTTNPLGTPGTTSFIRVYATICNPNANPVYLALRGDQAATTTNATYIIAAAAGYSACYEITDRNQYSGSITASSTNETSTRIFYTEYTQ